VKVTSVTERRTAKTYLRDANRLGQGRKKTGIKGTITMTTIHGTENANTFIVDTTTGLQGDDALKGGGGADALFDDAGHDMAVYLDAPLGVSATTGRADSFANVTGSLDDIDGDTMLDGSSGHDSLKGFGGNDTLDGSARFS
jgi:Ca2+-binding RTX toxin-like protein